MPTRRKMIVIIEQPITIGKRIKPDLVERCFTVYATTKKQAINAVRKAGHKGRLVGVEVVD